MDNKSQLIKEAKKKIKLCGGDLESFSHGYQHYVRWGNINDHNAYNTMTQMERDALFGDQGPNCRLEQQGRF